MSGSIAAYSSSATASRSSRSISCQKARSSMGRDYAWSSSTSMASDSVLGELLATGGKRLGHEVLPRLPFSTARPRARRDVGVFSP
jgi:hypothetical protein